MQHLRAARGPRQRAAVRRSAGQRGHVLGGLANRRTTTGAGVGSSRSRCPSRRSRRSGRPDRAIRRAALRVGLRRAGDPGPFILGTVVVRASIAVNPTTSALTVASNPLPTQAAGILLDIKTVNVTVTYQGMEKGGDIATATIARPHIARRAERRFRGKTAPQLSRTKSRTGNG